MPAIVIMGPSGCGKSTLGQALASYLGWAFLEGDDLHPRENIKKMSAGTPLNDSDRKPFLSNVANALRDHSSQGVVASCSALKKAYRDQIRSECPDVIFVLPYSSREQLLLNMKGRKGHFMPESLIDSQLNVLEVPGDDEKAYILDHVPTVEDAVSRVNNFLNE